MGRIYAANNEGVLVFDGINWKLFPLPNKTIVRSICIGEDGLLYAGGQDELGFFSPTPAGTLQFQSLKDKLPETDQNFADVWNIVKKDGEIFFRTNNGIFRLGTKKNLVVYSPNSAWLFLGKSQNQLFAQDEAAGIEVLQDGKWKVLVPIEALPNGFIISDILEIENGKQLLTSNFGLFALHNNEIQPFRLSLPEANGLSFTTASLLPNHCLVLGTANNGYLVADKKGLVLSNIDKGKGLQSNHLITSFVDKNNNLWLGLQNGISFVSHKNSIQHINPSIFNDGAGYAAIPFQDKMFYALSNGVFFSNKDADPTFTKISEDHTWKLNNINNNLFVNNVWSLGTIVGSQQKAIATGTGYWDLQKMTMDGSTYFVAGNYDGVSIFDATTNNLPGKLLKEYKIGSARYLAISNDTIWVSHPYRGVYMILPKSQTVELFGKQAGLPTNNLIFKLTNKVVVATDSGVYRFNPINKTFFQDPEFLPYFKNLGVRYLQEDSSGNVWFVQQKNLGIINNNKAQYIPELYGQMLSGFESIKPISKNRVVVGGEKGFYSIDINAYNNNIKPFDAYIESVSLLGNTDSLIFGGYPSNLFSKTIEFKNGTPLPADHNSLQFSFSCNDYENIRHIEYSYMLQGFDDKFSQYSTKSSKEYTGLPPGNYVFKVKARNGLLAETPIATYTFTIRPPWYKTMLAKALYVLLLLGLGLLLLRLSARRQKKRLQHSFEKKRKDLEEEQKQLIYDNQLKLEQAEKERIKLINENLEKEIAYKNNELTKYALNLVQKKEYMLKMKREVEHMQKNEVLEKAELKKLLKIFSDDQHLNEDWEHFSQLFNQANDDLLKLLKERYPDLKPHELKLCAYLRLNLSSKEIAQLLGISTRGVEISRYRLRKKLNLATETNLTEFLMEVK